VRRLRFAAALPLSISWMTILSAAENTPPPTPPVAKVKPTELKLHGDTRVDPYYWMREKGSAEVTAYLKAENAYTEAKMQHTAGVQETLFKEIVGRIKETDLSVPSRKGSYFTYSRTEQGKQYPIICRRKGSLEAAEEIILDLNRLAEGHKYFQLGGFRVSPDHSLLAYATDTDGSEEFVLQVRNLATGELLADRVAKTSYGIEWGADNKTLFYTTLAPTHRADKVWRHVLGSAAGTDVAVFHEPDEHFDLSIGKSRGDNYLFIDAVSSTTSEVRFLRADQPAGEFRPVMPRRHDVKYFVEAHGDRFFIRVNDTGKNFRLVWAPAATPGPEHWSEVIAHRDGVTIESVNAFRDYLVISERENGLQQIRIRDLTAQGEVGPAGHSITFPEPTYGAFVGDNPEFDTHTLRFMYTSLVTPMSVYDYDLKTRNRVLRKRTEIPSGYNPDEYVSERVFATAPDGAKVPISLVYKKGLVKDGKAPAYLYGYGSYGSTMVAAFDPVRLSLLDRGYVWALAHIRGGADMGRTWYDPNGKLLNKKNTFTDFIACAEHLIATKYTSAGRLAIEGGSAGGLLIGAVVNMRPDLFGVALAKVPFVDVVTTELDASLPGTVTEWEEWGNPNIAEFYRYIKSYSPYDNVRTQRYPAMLVTGGLNDPRVSYWEPAKWVAKLRAAKTDSTDLLLKINMGSGHFGQSGRYDRYRELAFYYAFVLDHLK
jgi:oligopeptidase B